MYNRQNYILQEEKYMSQIDTTEGRTNYVFDSSIFEGVTTTYNKAFLVGKLRGKFEHNYTSSATNEKYYKANISVPRKSGQEDHVRIMVPEKLIRDNFEELERGTFIKVSGALCSHLHTEVGKQRLRLYILVEKIEFYAHQEPPKLNNCIYLKGRIHKTPFKRNAVVSGKVITDLFLSVVREGSKWDFITCITWGITACKVSKLKVGDEIVIKGRLQSRMYFERHNGNPEVGTKREVHEVSVFELVSISESEQE